MKKIRKKAMSEVISTLLLIGLVLGLVAVVWAVVNNLVSKEIKSTEACFGNFDKIAINPEYTCYNLSDDRFIFSILVGDTKIDNIFVSISSQGASEVISLNSTEYNLPNVKKYNPYNQDGVSAPGVNSGKTYVYNGLTETPDSMRIAPVIGGEKCQESDSLTNIEACSSY